ncbi:SIS domain-containing protein [Clostridium perfringens]|nr:SIS domain-containing protein [Clostridium perfringens]
MENTTLLKKTIEDNRIKNEIILELIEEGACGDFIEKINRSNRIFIYGKGISSTILGQELKRAFTALGKYVFDFYKADEIDAVLSLIRDDDCMIIISLENSEEYLYKIKERLEKEEVSKFFIGLDKEKKVPVCSDDLERIDKNHDEVYEGLELYCMLIRFLYKLCNM